MKTNLPITFILITVVIDAMGIGLILPVMPDLIRAVGQTDISGAALWGGILSATFALMQFLFSPTLGALSDRFGRRSVLLTSNGVMALDYVLMALAGTMWLLLIGRIIGGITAATQATASAFMADISPREKKAQNFGLIGAAFGVGFVLGPVVGGLLAELGPRAPFWAAAILAGGNFLFGYFILPETLKPENRRKFELSRANPIGGLAAITKLPSLGALLTVYFFYQVANMVYPAIWAYYTAANFDWSPGMIGASLAIYGISIAFTQAVMIRWVIAKLGERKTVFWGLLYNAITLSTMAFITNGWLLLALTPMAAFGAVVAPAIQGIMSGEAPDNQQGELQGVMSSINALGMIFAPLMFTRVFSLFTASDAQIFLPGAPFLMAMGLMLTSWVVVASVLKRRPTTADAP